jgi:hypothetical protein
MHTVSLRSSHRSVSLDSFTLWASVIALAIVFTTGCATGSGDSGAQPPLAGNTAVTVLASSTGNDQLPELALGITGITLTDAKGTTVPLLTTQQNIEFMHLNGGVEPLTTASVPQDVYTSATVSVSYGIPVCVTYDTSGENLNFYSVQSASGSDVMVTLPAPITVTGTGMALELNLQVSKSTNFSTCAGIVTGPIPFSLTPAFNLTPVTLAAQPSNTTNGLATGLRGMIGTVTSGGTRFSVAGEFGVGNDAPIWQVSSNGSTVFQGLTGASQLATGMPVDMDVAIQADGSLLATRVAVYDTNPSDLSFSSGPQTSVAASQSYMAPLGVETQGPDFHGEGGDIGPDNFGGAVFQTSGSMTNVSSLPFTASFSGANMVPGQNVFVTTHSAVNNGPYQAATVTLIPQTLNGTVSAVSTSGNFTTYTLTLAAYDLFPDLAGQPAQNTLLTNPASVTVYVDSNTQMLNSDPIAVGSVLRFTGLVFNDNGTLRLDCAQVNDGVAE